MGIEETVYLIDLNKLQSLRGSNRSDLCGAIEAKFEPDHCFDDDDPKYREPGEPSVRQALRQFFDGRPFEIEYTSVYGNALWLLCSYFGTEIERFIMPDDDSAYRTHYVLKSRFHVPDGLWIKAPIDFPDCSEPSIHTLRVDAAEFVYSLLTPLNLERVNTGAAENITQLYGWLQKACEQHKDIVTFVEEV